MAAVILNLDTVNLTDEQFYCLCQVNPEQKPDFNLPSSPPFELWLINFHSSIDLSDCQLSELSSNYVTGYQYQKFLCGRSMEYNNKVK